MATTPKSVPAASLPNTATLLYLASNCRTTITKATATNIGTLNNTLKFYIVPVAGTAGTTNTIINDKPIAGKEEMTLQALVGQILQPGEALWGECPASTAITFRLSYIEQT